MTLTGMKTAMGIWPGVAVFFNVSTDYLLGYDIDTQLDLSGIDGENKENVLRLVGMLKEPVK